MLLDNGKIIYFGQHIEDVSKIFEVPPVDNPLRISRKGIDKQIKTNDVILDFDNGFLNTIEFKNGYQYQKPLKPFNKTWKNLTPIHEKKLSARMSRHGFERYLASWRIRAERFGVTEVKFDDLKEDEYYILTDKDTYIDMIHISMGPSRRAGGGGIWTDGWTILFSVKHPTGEMESITAFCDAFNSVARRVR